MSLSLNTKVAIPDNILTQNVRGESVLLNLNNECYFGLDKVGTRMWATLSQSESIEAACEALLDKYDVESDVLRTDLINFVEKMVNHGLLAVDTH